MTAPDPAAELREAASHMRREDPAQFGPEFWAALADWLEDAAYGYDVIANSAFGPAGADLVAGFRDGDLDPAIRTARAFLGTGRGAVTDSGLSGHLGQHLAILFCGNWGVFRLGGEVFRLAWLDEARSLGYADDDGTILIRRESDGAYFEADIEAAVRAVPGVSGK